MRARSRLASAAIGCAAALLAALALATPASAIPPGPRDVKVVIARFAGDAAYPFTPQQLNDAVFAGAQSANGFFGAITRGQTSLVSGGAIDQVTMTIARTDPPATSCDPGALIDNALTQAGVSRFDHDHVIVAIPPIVCPGSGWSDIGPPGGTAPPGQRVFLNGNILWRLISHELSHNLGTNHAGACVTMLANGDCTGNSYGDPFDIMGASTGSFAGFPSSWYQLRLGILSGYELVDRDGVYGLTAANDASVEGNELVMVPRGDGFARPFYALEIRTRGPYDNFLDPAARLYSGVTVRLAVAVDAGYTSGPANDTFLVPASPGSSTSTSPYDWPLLACQMFTDPSSGVSIRPLSVGNGTAQVAVALEGRPLPERPDCVPTVPPPSPPPTPPATPPAAPAPASPAAPSRPDRAVTMAIGGKPVRLGRSGVARIGLRCPRTEHSPPCRGTLTLRTRRKVRFRGKRRTVVLAKAKFRIAAGKTKRVRLTLGRRTAGLVRDDRGARQAVAIVKVADAAGNKDTRAKRLKLVPQRRAR